MAEKTFESLLEDDNKETQTTDDTPESSVEPVEQSNEQTSTNTSEHDKEPLEPTETTNNDTNKEPKETSTKVTESNTNTQEPEVKATETKEPVVEPKQSTEPETVSKDKEPEVKEQTDGSKEPKDTEEPKTVIEDGGIKGPEGVVGTPKREEVDDPAQAAIDRAEEAIRESERQALEAYRKGNHGSNPNLKGAKVMPSYSATPDDVQQSEPLATAQLKASPIKQEPAEPKTVEEQLAGLNLSPEKLAKVKEALSDEPTSKEDTKEQEPAPKAVYNGTLTDKTVIADGQENKIQEPQDDTKDLSNPAPEPTANFDEQLKTYIDTADDNYPEIFPYLTLDERNRYNDSLMGLRNGQANTRNILELKNITEKAVKVKKMQGR